MTESAAVCAAAFKCFVFGLVLLVDLVFARVSTAAAATATTAASTAPADTTGSKWRICRNHAVRAPHQKGATRHHARRLPAMLLGVPQRPLQETRQVRFVHAAVLFLRATATATTAAAAAAAAATAAINIVVALARRVRIQDKVDGYVGMAKDMKVGPQRCYLRKRSIEMEHGARTNRNSKCKCEAITMCA